MAALKSFVQAYLAAALLAVAGTALLSFNCFAAKHTPVLKEDILLRSFLQNYLNDPHSENDKPTRYSSAFINLNHNSRREVIVHITGRSWCGSGGCLTLGLAPSGSSYKVIAKITITHLPIRVLSDRINGWRDIGVWVQGGGIQPGHESVLQFDGKMYLNNPSVLHSGRSVEKSAGNVVSPLKPKTSPLYEEESSH